VKEDEAVTDLAASLRIAEDDLRRLALDLVLRMRHAIAAWRAPRP
jgi:hypothetical protein